MNKPDYLTQDQYDVIFDYIEEIKPSWNFVEEDKTLDEIMNVWRKWINAIAMLSKEFDSWNDYVMKRLRADENLMREVNDYIILMKI